MRHAGSLHRSRRTVTGRSTRHGEFLERRAARYLFMGFNSLARNRSRFPDLRAGVPDLPGGSRRWFAAFAVEQVP